jgi:hypothetical protein
MRAETTCAPDEHAADDLRDVPLDILCAEARVQEDNFVSGLPSDGAAGVELFRRAIDDRDDDAWAAVMGLYRGLLKAQVSRQVVRGLVDEDSEFCIDRAFQRFWQATRTGRMHQFTDLASILKYLKMCLGSVMLDEARSRRRQPLTSIDDVPADATLSADPTALVISHIAGRELWLAIEQQLHDKAERLVAHLSFVAGLTPREIHACHPEHFADISDVYRLKRNVIERLRRCLTIQRLLD